MKRALVWYRNDLRIHDHPPTYYARQLTESIFPLFIWRASWDQKTEWGDPKVGIFRREFTIEALIDLRESWKKLGANLLFRTGNPTSILTEICLQFGIDCVFYSIEQGTEEEAEELEAIAFLKKNGIESFGYYSETLHHPDDLPFDISSTPEMFTNYRKKVEGITPIRDPFAEPLGVLPLPEDIKEGDIPAVPSQPKHTHTAFPFRGGESKAKLRLQEFLWIKKEVINYKETRNGLLGVSYSSKLSPFLAQGSLGPRYIYSELKSFESKEIANESTYWFFFELLWRDYFKWILAKHKYKLFRKTGILGKKQETHLSWDMIEKWKKGQTGVLWIDAHMKELALTGYMSNRGRQNVASFFVHQLKQDWRIGASWFESLLIDYDVASNYGNWAYFSGVGNDPRMRVMNMESQSKAYDPEGTFTSLWNQF